MPDRRNLIQGSVFHVREKYEAKFSIEVVYYECITRIASSKYKNPIWVRSKFA
jgi:hypothetical protein